MTTTVSQFGPDTFTVKTKGGSNPDGTIIIPKDVDAKFLKDARGNYVLNLQGTPYVVPADFDAQALVDKFSPYQMVPFSEPSAMARLYTGFRTADFSKNEVGSEFDLQRTYNGISVGQVADFVPAFTPAASYAYGLACSAAGLPESACTFFAGVNNVRQYLSNPNVTIGPVGGNRPDNVPNILAGYAAASDGNFKPIAIAAPVAPTIIIPTDLGLKDGTGAWIRDSSSYITDNGAGSHSATINAGGTLSDLWVLQKNSTTGFANAQDFYAAVLASNPNITNVNKIQAGQSIYLPEKLTDGSVTYNYAGGASINSNATSGEYHMVVPNGEGGQTVYSRTTDGDAGYTVHQISTDKAGNTTFDFNGHQASLNDAIVPFAEQWHTGTESGSASFNTDGSLVKETVTDTDSNGQLQSKSVTDGTTSITTTTDYSTPSDPNIQSITTRDAQGNITGTSTISAALDTSGVTIPNTYDIVNKDGTGSITATGQRDVNPTDGSHTDALIGSVTAQNPNGTLTVSSTDALGNTIPVLSEAAQNTLATGAQSFNDAYALIKAIQSNQPLPILGSGLRLANDVTQGSVPEIGAAGNVLGVISSLSNLNNALQTGNVGNAVVAGANLVSGAASMMVAEQLPGQSIDTAAQLGVFGDAGGAVSAISEDVPYLNIANDLIQGNVAGAVGDGVGLYASTMMYAEMGAAAGPVGAVIGLVVGLVLSDLFGDSPPPPWGSASAVWDPASGTIRINAVGESGGDASARGALTNLEGSLANLAQQYNTQAQPDFQIGVIAQRLGGLSYSNQSYRVSTIDPATGAALNPNLSFDANSGQTLNADVNDPAYFQSIGKYYINNALARQAIAPLWEVQTAQQQATNNVSNAGLSEVERAANQGHLAAALPTGASTESWNPIGIDLGGGLATSSLSNSAVQFNVDGTANLDARITGTSAAQYLKQTQWLNSQDGFLVLDKNLNGGIDNAEELFRNSQVNAQSRGIASLGTWDTQAPGQAGYGVIDASVLVGKMHSIKSQITSEMIAVYAQDTGAIGRFYSRTRPVANDEIWKVAA